MMSESVKPYAVFSMTLLAGFVLGVFLLCWIMVDDAQSH